MALLFQTDFCNVIITANMTHLFCLGYRLDELSRESENVHDYLFEFSEGWSDYVVRMN